MRKVLRVYALVCLLCLTGVARAFGQASTSEAEVRVCGVVQEVSCDVRTSDTTIRIRPSPHDFLVTIRSADRAHFPPAPEETLRGADICVRGAISNFGLNRLLIVHDAASVEVRAPGPPAVPWSVLHYRECDEGVVMPAVTREVPPNYTGAAMQAKIQGVVGLEAMVTVEGRVTEPRVTHSLDAKMGLDREALAAIKQWRFKPATRAGVPVPFVADFELTFTLRSATGRRNGPLSRLEFRTIAK